jgi:AcrR family transcriptional regulator
MPNTLTPRLHAADRQRQLLEVALNIFSRRGFKGATTKEIAAAAGVTEAIIFQHFPSKEALYSAVLELHLDTDTEQKWVAEINDCMNSVPHPRKERLSSELSLICRRMEM